MNDFSDSITSNPAINTALWPAFVETLQMIGISGLFAFGWTTGVLVNLVSQAYQERKKSLADG